MVKLDIRALAETYEDGLYGTRVGVQMGVNARMIYEYVVAEGLLPTPSARAFSEYLYETWGDWVEDDCTMTHKDLLGSALSFWRGGA